MILTGGDVYISKPGEMHSTGGFNCRRSELYWITFKQASKTELFFDLPKSEGKELYDMLLAKSGIQIFSEQYNQNTLNSIFKIFQDQPDRMAQLKIRNLLYSFLLDIVTDKAPGMKKVPNEHISNAVLIIDKTIKEKITLTDLADSVGLSLTHFKNKFRKLVGTSPSDFIGQRKIHLSADKLINSKKTITEIALDYGFPSSQYFATVFKKYQGTTPGDWRAHHSRYR